MTEKKEAKYIGRYGEVLENVHKVGERKNLDLIMAFGLDRDKKKSAVVFEVSKKTGEKNGFYHIYGNDMFTPDGTMKEPTEISHYKNDLLHGSECHYFDQTDWDPVGEIGLKLDWLRGRGVLKKKRTKTAKNAKSLRQLFSDASVKEAIKTGSLLKVKTAMTRALKKKEMGE